MLSNIIPVILSGGSGTRLWPLSKQGLPKQFIPLLSEHTLFQEAILRLKGEQFNAPIIVCNAKHRSLVDEQIAQLNLKANAIILEPCGRNTAPAMAIAALNALKINPDPILLVLPADHAILNQELFMKAIKSGIYLAQDDYLVTFGVKPTRPETGYGYIKFSGKINNMGFRIEKFVEKPNLSTAEGYIASGQYYWNSGIFVFRAKKFLSELKEFAPAILEVSEKAMFRSRQDNNVLPLDADEFSKMPSISVDYALMEKTNSGALVPFDFEWSDVGTWRALWECKKKDSDGNFISGDVTTLQVSNSYIHTSDKKVIALGVKDHIIVETSDGLLIMHKDYCQDLQKVVK